VVEDSDFYEKTYSTGRSDVQTRVRNETYDEDLGQAGWLQATEAHEFASWLGSGVRSVLDVACGSGGISALLAEDLRAHVTGIDIDAHAVTAANERGAEGCSFEVLDANERLPFADGAFDVVFSNDSVHHLRDRSSVLRDWARVLRPTGQVLFTEGLVLTGPVSNEEIRRRTFMGFFNVTPPGANERAIEDAGLVLERAEDRSGAVADVGSRMRAARDRYRDEVIASEGAETFEAFQDLLDVAVSLAAERRLSRWVFHARKPGRPGS
jgi:SAM-dependent methyltransferase